MKKIRRLKIRVRTGRLVFAQGEADRLDDNQPPTEPQKCPLCGQFVEPNHSLNLLAACADEYLTANEEEE